VERRAERALTPSETRAGRSSRGRSASGSLPSQRRSPVHWVLLEADSNWTRKIQTDKRCSSVKAERTFWDKVIILHGTRRWFERRGTLRHGGHRVSRHYYDVFRLLQSPAGLQFVAGRLVPAPAPDMLDALRRDYQAMSGMIFGPIPPFEEVVSAVHRLEADIAAALGDLRVSHTR
jgi:hypothetical protein